MTVLTRHATDVVSVFELLGHDENDLTAALGFALSRSDTFLDGVLQHVWPDTARERSEATTIALEVRGEQGRTDLEITTPDGLVIIEAKRDWLLPTTRQLAMYAPRILRRGGGRLVTLSQASDDLAARLLPTQVDGVPVVHLWWRNVISLLEIARRNCRGSESIWLREFWTYLQRALRMRSIADSWTYCVVVSEQRPGGGGSKTFRDYIDGGDYFHPYATSGWPLEPANFIAFRWGGNVRRIHRVLSSEVVPTLQDVWPDIDEHPDSTRPHAVYRLGPRLPPQEPIPNGAQYRASRLWVLLDQLQTAPTLAAAVAASKALSA